MRHELQAIKYRIRAANSGGLKPTRMVATPRHGVMSRMASSPYSTPGHRFSVSLGDTRKYVVMPRWD